MPDELTYFTVTGTINGVRQTLGWVEGDGFSEDESAGQLALAAVRNGIEVCVTVTGPCFVAADRPAHVAYVTAISMFDPHSQLVIEGSAMPEVEETLDELTTVPEGAAPYTRASSPSTNDRISGSSR